jgi:hypothetical protein
VLDKKNWIGFDKKIHRQKKRAFKIVEICCTVKNLALNKALKKLKTGLKSERAFIYFFAGFSFVLNGTIETFLTRKKRLFLIK